MTNSDALTSEQRLVRATQWVMDAASTQGVAEATLRAAIVERDLTLHIDHLANAKPDDDLDNEDLEQAANGILECYRYVLLDGHRVLAETFAWTAERPAIGDHPGRASDQVPLPQPAIQDLTSDLTH